jgi:two-component system NtrC family sensor kinase
MCASDTAAVTYGIFMLKDNIRMDARSQNDNAHLHLMERVKELTCLYDIARIAADTSLSVEELLTGIVGILPRAWQYPNDAFAKIVFDNRIYSTPNYPRFVRRQRSAIAINGERRGYIEVAYLKKQGAQNRNPFLDEEQTLLDTVAREASAMIRRRETEQDKLKLEDQLRHADRLATIGQMAASVAHELNEPLGHILGFAELVQKCPGLPVQATADVEKIFNTSLHAREIVKQLLIFSRQASGQKTKANLNKLIQQGLTFLESRCVSEGIKIKCNLCPHLPEIDADPAQISQVFVCLIVNAIQAMPEGGTISIRTRRERDKVSFIIEDTGIGMKEEVLQKIFTPFFTTKEVGIGTGLGLPVVHGIITAHGGSIKIDSQVGVGTQCRIKLPAGRSRTC